MLRHSAACVPMLVLMMSHAAVADQTAILAELKAFFGTDNANQREEISRRIESDPVYDRARVSEWLHATDLFNPHNAGYRRIRVPIDDGNTQDVTLRIPAGYDQQRVGWPTFPERGFSIQRPAQGPAATALCVVRAWRR